MKDFKQILAAWLGDRSLTEVAPLLGVAVSTVHYWRAGDTVPPLTRIPALSEILGVPADELRMSIRSHGRRPYARRRARPVKNGSTVARGST